MQSQKKLDEIQQAKSNLQKEKREHRQFKQSIEASAGATEASNKMKQMPIVFLKNLPYFTTAKELVQVLESRLRTTEAIQSCEILTKSDGRTSTGKAYICLKDSQYVDMLMDLSRKLMIGSRKISIARNTNKKLLKKHYRQLTTTTIDIDHIKIGNPRPESSNQWCAQWGADKKVELHIHGIDQSISIEFDSPIAPYDRRFKLEFLMKHIRSRDVDICDDYQGRLVLVLTLRRPPRVFRLVPRDVYSQMLQNIFGTISLKEDSASENIWNSDMEERKKEADAHKWTRTVDSVSSNDALGRCLCYRLTIQSQHRSALLRDLYAFGLIRNQPRSTISSVVRLATSGASGHNALRSWTGLKEIDAEFQNNSISYPICYLVHTLIAQNRIDLVANKQTTSSFIAALSEVEKTRNQALGLMALEHMIVNRKGWFYHDPREKFEHWINLLIDDEELQTKPNKLASASLDLMLVRGVSITPLRCVPNLPQMCLSNRVLRHFCRNSSTERFLRVSFVDENFGRLTRVEDDILTDRIREVLRTGIIVGGRRFVFLAYGNSQLREHSCWFYDEDSASPIEQVQTAAGIRQWMGDFSGIDVVGKYAARLGQCFSNTIRTIPVPEANIHMIPDVSRYGSCFSDGVGQIDYKVAVEMSQQLRLKVIPSAFQIRFGGAKGVLTTMYDRMTENVYIRPSQKKFESTHNELELITYAKYIPSYLNRQVITILSGLGVRSEVFLQMLECQLKSLNDMTKSRETACQVLLQAGSSGNNFSNQAYHLLEAGFTPQEDPYLQGVLCAFQRKRQEDITKKARLMIPKSVCLLGIMDEYDILPPGTVFLQYQQYTDDEPQVICQDRVVVGRNPSLHAGDIHILRAIDRPELRKYVNVIIFPSQGHRSLPSAMSGGDLDGDLYFCIWNESLIPPKVSPPMESPSSESAVEPLSRKTTTVEDFFCNFIENDNLGRICNAHLAQADYQLDGIRSDQCLFLANLANIAVDFAKTGIAAKIPAQAIAPPKYPDFMEKDESITYESGKVLGQLYRRSLSFKMSPVPPTPLQMDPNIIQLPLIDKYLMEARYLRDEYNEKLYRLMFQYGVFDESEVCSGSVRKFGRTQKRRKVGEAQHAVNIAIQELQGYYRHIFYTECEVEFDIVEEGMTPKLADTRCNRSLLWVVLNKAAAWYKSCYDPTEKVLERPPMSGNAEEGISGRLLSFAWIMHEYLIVLKKYGASCHEQLLDQALMNLAPPHKHPSITTCK